MRHELAVNPLTFQQREMPAARHLLTSPYDIIFQRINHRGFEPHRRVSILTVPRGNRTNQTTLAAVRSRNAVSREDLVVKDNIDRSPTVQTSVPTQKSESRAADTKYESISNYSRIPSRGNRITDFC